MLLFFDYVNCLYWDKLNLIITSINILLTFKLMTQLFQRAGVSAQASVLPRHQGSAPPSSLRQSPWVAFSGTWPLLGYGGGGWGSWGPAESWALCFFSDNGWAQWPRALTQRVWPAEICLFSRAWALARGPRLAVEWVFPGKATILHRNPLSARA